MALLSAMCLVYQVLMDGEEAIKRDGELFCSKVLSLSCSDNRCLLFDKISCIESRAFYADIFLFSFKKLII